MAGSMEIQITHNIKRGNINQFANLLFSMAIEYVVFDVSLAPPNYCEDNINGTQRSAYLIFTKLINEILM